VTVPVALIAAVGKNGVIGAGDTIPWQLPSDFAFFKRTTLGKPLIMGRKTFETIGKPLPGRTNIIVTRQKGYQPDGVLVFDSLAAALEHAQAIAEIDRASEVMIGGGGQIYREALPSADRLYITHVDAEPMGDTTFPAIDPDRWTVVQEPDVPANSRDSTTFRVKVYKRRQPSAR
jgi:dihydrofolate reductase